MEETIQQTVTKQQALITELEKNLRKKEREISRLQIAVEREKIFANAQANRLAVQSLAQRIRDRYLQLLLNNSPSIIICFDNTRHIVFCSDALLKLIGKPDDFTIGRQIHEVLAGYDNELIETLNDRLSAVLADGEMSSVPVEISAQDGERRKYVISFIPMASSDVGNEGAITIFHDVTDIERTREEAVRASVAKSEFLSNMSHEMRTPMNAIIGMTAIAKASDSIERKDYCLNKIDGVSAHLLGVINDILDMSKIEANKLELLFESFDFEKMIQNAVNVINFRVEEKNQNFLVNIDAAIPCALIGDDQRLRQIITNLLSNAVKFTPDGGTVRLTARLAGTENYVYIVQVVISDTGIGINAEQQARLFRSFQQADSGTSRKFGGTGLGLVISKRLAEMMGGEIKVESELGKGATFTFSFRAKLGEEQHKNFLSGNVNRKTVRLLVVDDSSETLAFFHSEAARLNISCDLAESGEAALDMISRNGLYNIYFIDWKMPGINGIETARRIREMSSDKPSMVIMISGVDWNTIEEEANKAGVNRFLQKPLFRSDIVDCLNEYFGNTCTEEELAMVREEDFSGFRILLVEDVEINREIVLTLLEPTNLTIDYAENGLGAVKKVQQEHPPYDMILMDVQMPEMDGFEATRKIREFEAEQNEKRVPGWTARMPIIAMTANVFREDVEKCMEAGMDGHIGKPLNFEEVLQKLRLYLLK